jgi:alpha-beta hydrolase superfamily lysophospholipase
VSDNEASGPGGTGNTSGGDGVDSSGAVAGTAAAAPVLEESTLEGGIHYRHWQVDTPRAVALLVHGLGEHGGRYQYLAEALAGRGIAALAPDHFGHGRSPGTRCFVPAFENYFAPLDALRAMAESRYPGLPCFIIGHSMGGLITGVYLLERQERFAGAAFSGAAFAVPETPSSLALFINRLLAALWPTLGVMQLDASQISRDPEVVRAYCEDPLVHSGKISAKLVVELFRAMGRLEAERATLTLPVLVMHGEGDVMTPAAGSRDFAAAVGSSDRTLKIYPGLYHEIFNEPERDAVIGDLLAWLDTQLAKG